MANRYEQIAAIDLIKRINYMNENWYRHSQQMQDGLPEDMTLQEFYEAIKIGVNASVSKVAETTEYLFTKFAYKDVIEPGLSFYKANILDIESDCIPAKGALNTVSEEIPDLAALSSIGQQFEIASLAQKFETPLVSIPPELFTVTACNDFLDAMLYEFRGINSHSGQLHGYDIDRLRKVANDRLFCMRIHLSRKSGYESDYLIMENLYNYIKNELPKVIKLDGFLPLAQTIEDNIPRLILWRRWWSF